MALAARDVRACAFESLKQPGNVRHRMMSNEEMDMGTHHPNLKNDGSLLPGHVPKEPVEELGQPQVY